jgi:NTP pyrophosphatase (non-canonical NTP hydrolase)
MENERFIDRWAEQTTTGGLKRWQKIRIYQGGKMEDQKPYKPFEFWAEEAVETHHEIDRVRFIDAWEEMEAEVHHIAVTKGWWDSDRSDGEIIALIHSELSECLEACRKGYPKDKHLPHRINNEVELADAVIRIMDFAGAKGWDVCGALAEKVEYNRTRPFKHGKRF